MATSVWSPSFCVGARFIAPAPASFPRKRESENRSSQVSEEWSVVPRTLRLGGMQRSPKAGMTGPEGVVGGCRLIATS